MIPREFQMSLDGIGCAARLSSTFSDGPKLSASRAGWRTPRSRRVRFSAAFTATDGTISHADVNRLVEQACSLVV